MKFFTKEVQIALVAIVGIVVLFFGMQFLKGLSIFSTNDSYYVKLKDISGLSVSSPVYANGYKVGVVKDIVFDYSGAGNIVAEIDLDDKMRLPKGTTAEIESDMLGNVKMNIVLAANNLDYISAGDTLQGGKASGALDKAAAMIPAIEKVLPKLDSIMGSLNVLLADPALANSLHNVDEITANLTTTTKELNTLMGGLNKNMPGMLAHANNVLESTDKITKDIATVDISATMAKVDATLANVQQLSAKLNSNDGTLGLLMRDPSLYNNLTATMRDADSLLIDLKAHPKRYVHFSIFGRKDKQ
ncbi:MAG: MCE family protein [Prevotella sp.]|nr:MCE family protein [Prevotella sp.]MBR2016921.1 MCE family protein [Prevotella sp.]MBR2881021.1 MCE family protein [Prevotella sp.]MBR6591279.1 MCE family protein [Prevotella sp.]